MSYDAFENSVESSRPVELFTITLGVTIWRYVTGILPITISGDTWEPLAISREATGQSKESSDRQVAITVPADTPIVRDYIDSVPGQTATVRIERYQQPDGATPQRIILFDGAILAVTFEGSGKIAKISVQALDKALSRVVPRDVYSGICNHVLYDPRCTVVKTTYRIIGTVSAVSGRDVTVPGVNAQPDGYFQAGFIENTSSVNPDRRLVLKHVGNVLTLSLPFAKSVLGQVVRVHAGCDHTPQTCKSKFNNLPNFGGFPFVPTKNVFNTGLK
jgi:uncharacterized phage protein (TIGR02218 family)